MDKKQQILVIHGGTTFKNQNEYACFLQNSNIDLAKLRLKKDWKDSLQARLGDSFDVLQPRMPNSTNAHYEEWKLWLDKVTALLDENILLVGHSLGGTFLTKYLSENHYPKKIRGVFLVAAPFDDEGMDEPLGSFARTQSLDKIMEQAKRIFLYYSRDDVTVPFVNVEKYKNSLPQAVVRIFEDRGHFKQEYFPELIEDIRDCASRAIGHNKVLP